MQLLIHGYLNLIPYNKSSTTGYYYWTNRYDKKSSVITGLHKITSCYNVYALSNYLPTYYNLSVQITNLFKIEIIFLI